MLPEEFLNQLIPHMLQRFVQSKRFYGSPCGAGEVGSVILEIYEKPEDFFFGKSYGMIPQQLFHILLRK